MNRREALTVLGAVTAPALLQADTKSAALPVFWKSRLPDVAEQVKRLKKGSHRVLLKSSGGRDVHLIAYGAKQDQLATANYNSACGGSKPAAYARKDGKQKPVVFILGPVHGQEIEGIVGIVNLLHVAETGQDYRGQPWPELAANLAR